MKNKTGVLITIWLCCSQLLSAQINAFLSISAIHDPAPIIIGIQLNTNGTTDSVDVEYLPAQVIGSPEREKMRQKLTDGNAIWSINTKQPVNIYTGDLFIKQSMNSWLAEPGDEVTISVDQQGQLSFSGKSEARFRLQYQLKQLDKSIKKPSNPVTYSTKSLADYLEWNDYLNAKLSKALALIDSYKGLISSYAYQYLKVTTIYNIEDDRQDKFARLWLGDAYLKMGLDQQDLCNVFDSTLDTAPAKWMRSLEKEPCAAGTHGFIMNEIRRKFNFKSDTDELNSELKRRTLYYEQGKKSYKGLVREEFLVELLTYWVIKKIGITLETEALLERYYKEPGFPEYKQYVKALEAKARVLKKNNAAPDFRLEGVAGNLFGRDDLKDKVALMDFWFTGCKGCVQMAPALGKIEHTFKNDPNFISISISTDMDKSTWLKSIDTKKYTSGTGLNLYTGEKGDDHPILKAYNISSYPSLFLLDPQGMIVTNPVPDPRADNGQQLIDLIGKELMYLKDGPYVLYKNDSIISYSFNGPIATRETTDQQHKPLLTVPTDQYGKSFSVSLKKQLQEERSEFPEAQKLLALSDIEGNFDAFRKLLQSNKVIDDNYNWAFGNGHLVLIGDMFDRGKQVTECLWLIYSLEEKAKTAGGYVHFILGNHEIMNLSGDNRYVIPKYKTNGDKIGKSYAELFDTNSELGRWLRTKNIIEKIGTLLFTHGGISKQVNDLPLSVTQLNDLARPWYDNSAMVKKTGNASLSVLYNSKLSPFWYRDYYLGEEMKIYSNGDTSYKTPMQQVDKTLKKFGSAHIVTGHTIVEGGQNSGSRVTASYDNKVINTDTEHAEGKSEGLLVEGQEFYRTNDRGEKVLLFTEKRTQ